MKYTSVVTNIAKKYACAFLNLFSGQITHADISKIVAAHTFLQDHRETLFFLQLPQFTDAVRLSMIEDLVGYCALPQECIKLFLLLTTHSRAFLIPDVLWYIEKFYKKRSDSTDFIVKSAHVLNDTQKDRVKAFLYAYLGKNGICTYVIDSSLIAGIRIQSSDYMWEYSVRKQLLCLQALAKSRDK